MIGIIIGIINILCIMLIIGRTLIGIIGIIGIIGTTICIIICKIGIIWIIGIICIVRITIDIGESACMNLKPRHTNTTCNYWILNLPPIVVSILNLKFITSYGIWAES